MNESICYSYPIQNSDEEKNGKAQIFGTPEARMDRHHGFVATKPAGQISKSDPSEIL